MFRSPFTAEDTKGPTPLRLPARLAGFALGVWVCLYPFIDLTLRPRYDIKGMDLAHPKPTSPVVTASYAALVLSGIAAILACGWIYQLDLRRAKFFAAAVFLFALSIPLSFFTLADTSELKYVVLIDLVLIGATILVSMTVDGETLMQAFFRTICVALGAAMVAVLIDHDFVWGRLVGRTAPNYWGGLAMAAILSSTAIRSWLLKAPLIGLSLFIIFVSQSRSEMMALSVAVPTGALLGARHPEARRWAWLWFAAPIGLAAVTFAEWGFVADRLLFVADPARGVGSGLTGRSSNWREAWAVFTSHPWLGVGYQQTPQYVTGHLGVHNGYLGTLADTGVVGCLGYMIFFVGALWRSLVQAWREPIAARVASAAYLTAYATLSLTEPTGLHIGNTLSMIMLITAAWSWRAESSPRLRPARIKAVGLARPPAEAAYRIR